MGKHAKHYFGGVIGASPLDSNGAPRPGVSNLGGISGDNAFEAPSLDLDFDGQASSFTRATTSPTAAKANGDQLATSIVTQNKSGTVQSKYMGPDGKLVNGYVTNLIPQSTGTNLVWPNTAWTGTGYTGPAGEWGYSVSPAGTNLSFVAAPDGTNTAVRFQKPATTYSVARLFMGTTAGAYQCANGATQTVSFWIRNRLSSSGNIVMQPYADSNGHADTPAFTQSDMPQNEWVRLSHTFTNNSGGTLGQSPARSSWDIEFQTNVAHDFDLWGLQLEEGAAASQYVSTSGASASDQVPRVEFDVSGNPLGLLVEEARENLMTSTDNVGGTGAGYFITSGGFTVTDNHGTAPDGTSQANRLVNAGGSFKQVSLSISGLNIASGDVYTASVYYKATPGSSTSPNSFRLTLAEGSVGSTASSNLTATSEWQRAVVTRTCTTTNTSGTLTFRIQQPTSGGTDILVWGAQLEKGEGATSHIPNTAASGTKTRPADDITLSTSSFGYSDVAGSVLADFTLASETSSGDFPHVWTLTNAAGTSKIAAFMDETATPDNLDLIYRSYAGGANPGTYRFRGTVTQPTYGSAVALSMRYADGNFGSALDGTLNSSPTENTGGEAYTGLSRTSVELGGDAVGNAINGHIRRFTYWPRAISDASLVAYTGTNPPTIDIDRPMRRWGGITGRSLVESRVDWTPADIASATVVGWFDGENVNGGSAGNSGATAWVNKAGGANLNFTGSPTVGTTNVRTASGAYLGEAGTPSFLQTSDWRVFIAATINGGSGTDQYAPLFSSDTGNTNTGAFIYWKTTAQEFASYPPSWGYIDPIAPTYRSGSSSNFLGNPAVIDFKASTTNPWEIAFDGGRSVSAVSSTYTSTVASNQAAYFGYSFTNTRRLDANYFQIVIVHGTLSSDDEARLYSYLAHKAGSQSYLQTSAYSSAPPTRVVTGPTSLATTPALPTTGVLSLAEDYQGTL